MLIRFFSIAVMAESKKGHNFAILGPNKKNTRSLMFCTDATYKLQDSTQIDFQETEGT